MQNTNSIFVPVLIGASSGLIIALITWFIAGFIGRPVLNFFDRRKEAKQLALLLWRAPYYGLNYTPLEHRRIMNQLKEKRDRLGYVGAEIFAFSQSNRLATKFVKAFGFDPAKAGKAIDTIVFQLGTNIEDRDKNYEKLDKTLKFRTSTKGYFYDPYKTD